jgi:imidazolonepropionase-like amidohydrolase
MKSLFSFLCLFPVLLSGQMTIIKDVQVLDVENRKLIETSVVVDGETIREVTRFNRIKTTPEDRIIDGKGKFLIPGLIDSHIHFFQSGGLYTRPDAVDLRGQRSYAGELEFARKNIPDYLSRYLRLGITSVIDVGGPFWNFKVRDSLARAQTSPDVLVTGPLFSIVERPQLDEGDPPIVRVQTRADVDALFNRMLPYKPDFIKVWYIASKAYPPQDSYPLVAYLGELCRANNLKLAVHATQLETAMLAVKAGANILVHSVDDALIPEAFVQELRRKNVSYNPTLTVGGGYYRTFTGNLGLTPHEIRWSNPAALGTLTDLQHIEKGAKPGFLEQFSGLDPSALTRAEDSIMYRNLRTLADAGVNIITGTDAGNIGTQHAASYLHELEAMAEAGLTPWELLQGSTINPARAFGIGERTGSVAPGKQADLVLLDKNPLEGLQHLTAIAWVMKSGELLLPDAILAESPEQLVQRQLNAYNARDIDAFLDTYSEDVEIYDAGNTLIMKGTEQMRPRYSQLFEGAPNLHCEIQGRIVINNKVIDREHVRVNDRYLDAVAVYEVVDGKISKVHFVE